MKKLNFSVFKPVISIAVGLKTAKLIDGIPKISDNLLYSGLAKIGVAIGTKSFLTKKMSLIDVDTAAGTLAYAGAVDLLKKYVPTIASFIAAPGVPGGNPLSMRRPLRNQMAGADETVKYQ